MPTQKLTNDVIGAAIDGFEAQKAKIDLQIAELRSMLSGSAPQDAETGVSGSKRKISAAARHRMAMAQRARWAKVRGQSGSTAAKSKSAAPKAKRRISPEGMRNIIEATKRRWALQRAAAAKGKKPAKKTASKKTAAKRTPKPAVATATE